LNIQIPKPLTLNPELFSKGCSRRGPWRCTLCRGRYRRPAG